MAATVDLFPTISKLADIPLPTDRIIDGVDMAPILFEDKTVRNLYAHNYLLQYLWMLFYIYIMNHNRGS